MKIAFFTESGFIGKIPRNYSNMRTDVAWMCALDAMHYPIDHIHTVNDYFDLGIVIIPKNKDSLYEYPLIDKLQLCRKVHIGIGKEVLCKHSYGIIQYYNRWI